MDFGTERRSSGAKASHRATGWRDRRSSSKWIPRSSSNRARPLGSIRPATSSSRSRRKGPEAMNIDPVTLVVLQNSLRMIANEMDMVHQKASFSPVISEILRSRQRDLSSRNRGGDRAGRYRAGELRRRHAVHHAGGHPTLQGCRAGRHPHRQRSVFRRHASHGCEDGAAVLLQRPAVVLADELWPLAGYRRHGAGWFRRQRDRDPAGRITPAAGEDLPRRRHLSGYRGHHSAAIFASPTSASATSRRRSARSAWARDG